MWTHTPRPNPNLLTLIFSPNPNLAPNLKQALPPREAQPSCLLGGPASLAPSALLLPPQPHPDTEGGFVLTAWDLAAYLSLILVK